MSDLRQQVDSASPPASLRQSAGPQAGTLRPTAPAEDEPILYLPLGEDVLRRLSHEARTPLTVILSTSESLLEGGLGVLNAGQLDAVLLVQTAGQRLLRMIEDLLVFMRLRAERHEADFRRVSTQSLLDGAMRYALSLRHDGRAQIEVQPLSVPGGVVCDEQLVQRALFHLIDNAIKFNRAGGICSVQGSVVGKSLQLRVHDEGPGIAPTDRELVFEPFVQLAHHPDRRHRGAGIGLALVREVARLHGGRSWIEENRSGGCTACFEIPLERTVEER